MNGFWEAIGRAALGRQGAATPRPRSIYEPDVSFAAIDETEAVDDASHGDAPVRPAFPSGPDHRSAPEPRNLPEIQTTESEITSPKEQEQTHLTVEPTHTESRVSEPASPGVPEGDVHNEIRQLAPARTVERFELRQVETIHERTESVLNFKHPEVPAPVASVALSVEPDDEVEPEKSAEPEELSRAGAVTAAIAEAGPVAFEPVSVALAAQESPLIIEIDHIEIRIEAERIAPPPAQASRPQLGATLSLADYLARRSEALR